MNITPQDLRIGNWLRGKYCGFEKDIIVHSFNHTHIQHTDDKQNFLPLENFTPIILDDKWLIKLGANKISDLVYGIELHRSESGFYGIKLIYHIDSWKWWLETNFQTKVKYVHEFQNLLYSLTGK